MENKRAKGRTGEQIALLALKEEGYAIVETNFWTRYGEIDIIADDGGVLCFIEVKARSSRAFGTPLDSITTRKRATMTTVAAAYIERHGGGERDMRFDIVSVDLTSGRAAILRNAFDAESEE